MNFFPVYDHSVAIDYQRAGLDSDEAGDDPAVGQFMGTGIADSGDLAGARSAEAQEKGVVQEFGVAERVVGFEEGELVEVFPDVVMASFFDGQVEAVFNEVKMEEAQFPGRFSFFKGQGGGHMVVVGEAGGEEGAYGAVGVAGGTAEGSEFHEGLVVEAGVFGIEEQ